MTMSPNASTGESMKSRSNSDLPERADKSAKATEPSFSIEAIVIGRNDDYEPNWFSRLKSCLAYNRQLFAGSRVDYRVAFVEWNPLEDRPLLAHNLVEEFSFVRAIVVDAAVHERLCESDELTVMLNFAYNAGLTDRNFNLLGAQRTPHSRLIGILIGLIGITDRNFN